MKLEELYLKDITREVNPAVSADDFSDSTVKTEIEEYVFTDDIINALYGVMSAIKDRKLSHDGIWINGYFGSGKSHFIKFLDYCLSGDYRDMALARLTEAVIERDPLQVPSSKSTVMVSDMNDLVTWIKTATIDTILFNIGTVHNARGEANRVFLDVFWNEFNAFRGYNKQNLALAQYFEKTLNNRGVFDQFKASVKEDGFDWDTQAVELATTELDYILEKGKELVPTMSIDIIRRKIEQDSIMLSVETFMAELKEYLADKGDNYRLIFMADEVSQFIDKRKGLLLQLQEIVTNMHNTTEDKIWLACTAQQDLSEVVQSCDINEASEDYGKIMGRFQVKISLKGTNTEYITQKRILDKNGSGEVTLSELYDSKKDALNTQFNLPAGYHKFENQRQFIDYYPFVPYQFTLMTKVFDAFVTQDYVDREVSGSERSIIKVTHSTAKDTKDQAVGDLVSFDQFFNGMFQGSLKTKALKTIEVATKVIEEYSGDKEFAMRVLNILFMICNMAEEDKVVFAANVDNISCLLMRDIDSNKLALKNKVQLILNYLCDSNIIRIETSKNGVESYNFYSEDERKVADAIKAEIIDRDTMATQFKSIIESYLSPSPREFYGTRNFNVGATVMGKTFLQGNPDVKVEFDFDSELDANTYAFNNGNTRRLVFFMADFYRDNTQLKNDFYWYCQVQKYLQKGATSEERQKTHQKFRQDARDKFEAKIKPAFQDMLDNCVVLSESASVDTLGNLKGPQRYKKAIEVHLSNIYTAAKLVEHPTYPKDSATLREKILRPIDANEYGPLSPLSPAEKKIEEYLDRQGIAVNLRDIVVRYSDAPYGWNEACTIYVVNELVRRHKRDYTFNNAPNVERDTVASNIMNNQNKFMVCPAKAISAALINDFVTAWQDIFNSRELTASLDSAELFKRAKDMLDKYIENANKDERQISRYPFASILVDVVNELSQWKLERDPEKFFNLVISRRDVGKSLMDKRKEIRTFIDDQLTKYKTYWDFVDANRDNWEFLPNDQEEVKNMVAIQHDDYPIGKIPTYKKLYDSLNKKLNAVKEELRGKIRKAYEDTFSQLEQFAAEEGVPYTPKKDIIDSKTLSSNLAVLKNNINTDDFYTSQAAVILSAKPKPKPKPNDQDDRDEHKDNAPKDVRLNTRSIKTLKSAADVDEYLDGIRKQLMDEIEKHKEIIII